MRTRRRAEPGQLLAVFCGQMGLSGDEKKAFVEFAKGYLPWINERNYGADYRTVYELGPNELHLLYRKLKESP
jgi:hypothetical protein